MCSRDGRAEGTHSGLVQFVCLSYACSIAIGKHGTCAFAISWDLFGR